MACAVATSHTVGENHTVGFNPYGMANLYRRFFCSVDREYGSGRTNLGTTGAFRAAMTALIA